MANVLDDLGSYLQSVGLGTLGTTIFKGCLPLDAPHVLVQDALLALVAGPGLPAQRVHDGPGASIDQPIIEVITRGQPHDYEETQQRADAAYLALDGLTNVPLNGTFYLWVLAQQPPFVLRQVDGMGRPHIAFNVRCARARQTAPPLPPLTAYTLAFVQQTHVVIPGTTHRMQTPHIVYALYDAQIPHRAIQGGTLALHPGTRDVTLTFALPQSGIIALSDAATPGVSVPFTATTSVAIPGSSHGLGTADLIWQVYDDGIPEQAIQVGTFSVDPLTFDVVVTFTVAQSGRIVLYGAQSA